MNFDPFDSAVWRSLNMLDADEAHAFDEAMKHDPLLRSAAMEMEAIATAVAATLATVQPVPPDHLEHLLVRLKLKTAPPNHLPMAIAGWSATAILAILLTLHLTGWIDSWPSKSNSTNQNASATAPGISPAATPVTAATQAPVPENRDQLKEIATLRAQLERAGSSELLESANTPGMAMPLVVALVPPGDTTGDSGETEAPGTSITRLLGDALTALTRSNPPEPADATPEPSQVAAQPIAIPIYDAARDLGSLVVHDLPTAPEGQSYHLWVTPKAGAPPVYVGSLPEKTATGSAALDFNLGSTRVLPTGFFLTLDSIDTPAPPSVDNTVLLSPVPSKPPSD